MRFAGPLRIAGSVATLAASSFHSFEECQLRGAWTATKALPLLPSGPGARLGSVVHRLFEIVSREVSRYSTTQQREACWARIVSEVEAAMAASHLEARFVPLKDSAPQYELVRLRALARAEELIRASPHAGGRAGANAGTEGKVRLGTEVRVESSDGRITGRVDRILATASGPVLQDYKTGAILNIRHGAEPELKPEYFDQLRLYAALYFESTGSWPVALQVVPLAGSPWAIPYLPADALQLIARARAMLAEVNATLKAAAGDWEVAEVALAGPSGSACRFCAYRPACKAYISFPRVSDDRTWPADVLGVFKAITRLGNGRLMLSLTLADGSTAYVRGITDGTVVGAGLESLVGAERIGVFGAKRTQTPSAFEEGPVTMIYTSRNRWPVPPS
jgi:RecB family exonuclease